VVDLGQHAGGRNGGSVSISLPPDRSYHTAAGFVLSQLGHLPDSAKVLTDTVGVSRWSISMVAALTKFWPVASPLGAAAAQLDELASFSCSAPGNVLLHRVGRLLAHRDASLRRTDWVAIEGIADMPGASRTSGCDATDPKRTFAAAFLTYFLTRV
jgi:hypothetical protein